MIFAVLDGFYRFIVIEEVLECVLTEIFDLSFFYTGDKQYHFTTTNQPPLNFSETKSLVTNGNSKGFYCRRPENIRYEGNV